MAFTPQAKAEKALKELQKLPGNKRCADCSGNGSLVRPAGQSFPSLGPPAHRAPALTAPPARPAGAAVRLRQLRHLHLPELQHGAVRSSLAFGPTLGALPLDDAADACCPLRQPRAQPPRQGRLHVRLFARGGGQAASSRQRGAAGTRSPRLVSAPDARAHAGGARALHARLHRQAAGRRVRALAACSAVAPRRVLTRRRALRRRDAAAIKAFVRAVYVEGKFAAAAAPATSAGPALVRGAPRALALRRAAFLLRAVSRVSSASAAAAAVHGAVRHVSSARLRRLRRN